MFSIVLKSGPKTGQSTIWHFAQKIIVSYYKSRGLKYCRTEISTQNPLRCQQIEGEVSIVFLDTLLNLFSLEKCQADLAIKANHPQKTYSLVIYCKKYTAISQGHSSSNSSHQDHPDSSYFYM